jgi:hypothetical protein
MGKWEVIGLASANSAKIAGSIKDSGLWQILILGKGYEGYPNAFGQIGFIKKLA